MGKKLFFFDIFRTGTIDKKKKPNGPKRTVTTFKNKSEFALLLKYRLIFFFHKSVVVFKHTVKMVQWSVVAPYGDNETALSDGSN